MKCVVVVLAALLMVACSGDPPVPVVDGWPIGRPALCEVDDRCDELLTEAVRGLAERDQGHPAIVGLSLHDEGPVRDADGNQILMTRSGRCCRVVRFDLADGSVRAIGVGFPGVSQTAIAIDYGP